MYVFYIIIDFMIFVLVSACPATPWDYTHARDVLLYQQQIF